MLLKIKGFIFNMNLVTHLRKFDNKERRTFHIAVATTIKDNSGKDTTFWFDFPAANSRDAEWDKISKG
jgi:hypothetical protein